MLTFNRQAAVAALIAAGLAAPALAQSTAEHPLTPPPAAERQAPAVGSPASSKNSLRSLAGAAAVSMRINERSRSG